MIDENKIRKLWLEYAEQYCNNKFDEDNLPAVVELFLDNKVESFKNAPNPNVKSESLSDMSLTYFDKEFSKEDINLLGQVRRLKSVK